MATAMRVAHSYTKPVASDGIVYGTLIVGADGARLSTKVRVWEPNSMEGELRTEDAGWMQFPSEGAARAWAASNLAATKAALERRLGMTVEEYITRLRERQAVQHVEFTARVERQAAEAASVRQWYSDLAARLDDIVIPAMAAAGVACAPGDVRLYEYPSIKDRRPHFKVSGAIPAGSREGITALNRLAAELAWQPDAE